MCVYVRVCVCVLDAEAAGVNGKNQEFRLAIVASGTDPISN